MQQFRVSGPFKVPTKRLATGSKTIGKEEVKRFWASHGTLKETVGAYIFAIQAGGGHTPMYVGKATKSFGQEVFTTDKLNKYFNAMGQYKSGTPVIFLVASPKKPGVINSKHIAELEKFLIQQGRVVNPDLLNKVHAKPPAWSIDGALRSKVKKPTKSAQAFRKSFALAG